MPKPTETTAPLIRRLTVEPVREIEKRVCFPDPAVNVVLGGDDVGKTTTFDVIAVLLSTTITTILSGSDYLCRDVGRKILVEVVTSNHHSWAQQRPQIGFPFARETRPVSHSTHPNTF